MTILMRRACRDDNDWTKKRILFLRLIISFIPPPFLAVARALDLHSGVCYFIEFDARYLASSVRFLGDLVWSAASFWAQSFCSFAFRQRSSIDGP